MTEHNFAEYEGELTRGWREWNHNRILEEAIEILWGEKPDKIHRNAGSLWFDKDGRSYFLMIEECYPD
jgi:hypothetical protein